MSTAGELEQVLAYLTTTVIDYVKRAESSAGTVGTYHDPKELVSDLANHAEAVAFEGQGFEGLQKSTQWILENSVVTWNAAFLEKLYAGTNPVGVASDLLLSVLNTNSHVYTASPALTVIEKYVSTKYANLFGFTDRRAGGLTFPGGSYSNMTSMQIARSILFPETKTEGLAGRRLAVFTSQHSHYSVVKSAIMLGLGQSSVFKVPVQSDGTMLASDLDAAIQKALDQDYTPFYVNATAGSTVYGSFDDLNAIADVAEKHKLWLHVDGSWGGNVVFSDRQKHKLSGSERAQSLTVNPHKMLGVPCTCSFLLVPDVAIFQKANSLEASYLFHSSGSEDEDNFDLADGTMGCGRRSDAVKLYLGWQWYGTQGYAQRVDHAFDMTEYLARKIAAHPKFVLLSTLPPPCLQTCFWFANSGKLEAKEETTRLTREISLALLKSSKFLIDYSSDPDHGDFFRVVLNSPAVNTELLDKLVDDIVEIGESLS